MDKKELKKLVKETFDEALSQKKCTGVFEDKESGGILTFEIELVNMIVRDGILGVRLSTEGWNIILYSENYTRKEMIKRFVKILEAMN